MPPQAVLILTDARDRDDKETLSTACVAGQRLGILGRPLAIAVCCAVSVPRRDAPVKSLAQLRLSVGDAGGICCGQPLLPAIAMEGKIPKMECSPSICWREKLVTLAENDSQKRAMPEKSKTLWCM